ncbi:thioredoxin [Natronoarchaeum rubrum]|uniref:thioredoxin n=1 Tax=Natronoarchaeum rubrum TaxID=755311 RepID=UPI002111D4A7|nr:thioredoxin [Natronoarchaeum rubrum]
MSLETMEPTPTWDADAHEETVDVFAELAEDDSITIKVWGGDWCKDCRAELPDFGAALDAAEFPEDRVEEIPVDEDKDGPLTDEYDVELIATIVVERDGEEIVRFEEEEPVPAAVYLADELRESELSA